LPCASLKRRTRSASPQRLAATPRRAAGSSKPDEQLGATAAAALPNVLSFRKDRRSMFGGSSVSRREDPIQRDDEGHAKIGWML